MKTALKVPNSLSSRLVLFTTGWMVICLIAIGIWISAKYRADSELRFTELVTANLYNLMGVVEVSENGSFVSLPRLGDGRYRQYLSGWYWKVTNVKNSKQNISSASLAGSALNFDSVPEFDQNFQRRYRAQDINGKPVLVVEAQVFLGEGDDLFLFSITGDLEPIEQAALQFRNNIVLLLLGFGAGMVLAGWAVIRIGMRPIDNAVAQLGAIRDGKKNAIEGAFPDEIVPFVEETNALLKSNQAIVERSRTQVGNLAHSLKTPISSLRIDVERMKGVKREKMLGQLDAVSVQISSYLNRAAISARHATFSSRTDVSSVIQSMQRVFSKLFPHLTINAELEPARPLIFGGEKQDFEEMLGNILENAGNWAKSTVNISAHETKNNGEAVISVIIEDDGPGIDQSDIERALKRGYRLDESKPGTGLGLSIVSDTIREYGGEFFLNKAELGGLHVQLILPGKN